MRQPNLSLKNVEILEQYGEQLAIPQGEKAGKTMVVAVGDPYQSKSGKSTLQTILVVQKRNDLGNASTSSKADEFFMGWTNERLVRKMRNATSEAVEAQGIAPGLILEGFNISVNYGTKPFYDGQDPVINPQTGEVVTSGGKDLYREEIIVYGPAEHTGLDLERDQIETEEVATAGVSLEDDF